ncbi:hypothetical protein ESA94_05260 [Lacibacter luteus]|uniref:Uncharacterized protein n=1 Tax=Lacibacter luteus TaxID=2508719 RepID=A0A4Q1CMV5_9BACT|nr:hypothetical protein [Lacibacter luteus]RXK62418.1 hypothetical protein ESA94_05260 [Lacibacter luteus]
MQLRLFLFLLSLSFACSVPAQNFSGVWEGSFFMNGKKKQKMNLLIELVQQGNAFMGVVNVRGLEKGTIYGCDYVVAGKVTDNVLVLTRRKVQRAIAIDYNDCVLLKHIELYFDRKDSSNVVRGNWVWSEEEAEEFVAQRTGAEISESAKDELNKGLQGRGDAYEEKLRKERTERERMNKKIDELTVDSLPIILTVSLLQKTPKASIAVLLNSRQIAEDFNLSANVFDMRFRFVNQKSFYIDIINTSNDKQKLPVKIVLQQGSFSKEWNIEIEADGGNVWLLLKRRQE